MIVSAITERLDLVSVSRVHSVECRSRDSKTTQGPGYGEEMSTILDDLRAAVGDSAVLVDPDVTQSYQRDMMPLAPHGQPLAVVLPGNAEEVQAVVRACAKAGVPVVPRGAGSGLSGAANAIEGCV